MSAPWAGRLASLVRVRQIREDLAAAELRLAAKRRAGVLAQVAEVRSALARSDLPLESIEAASARSAWLDLVSAELDRLAEAQADAEEQLREAQANWLSAMRRRQAAERLVERRRETWLAEARRAEQKLLDETAEHRWSVRRSARAEA